MTLGLHVYHRTSVLKPGMCQFYNILRRVKGSNGMAYVYTVNFDHTVSTRVESDLGLYFLTSVNLSQYLVEPPYILRRRAITSCV